MYCGEQHGYLLQMKQHTLWLKSFIDNTNKMYCSCCDLLLKSTQKTWVTKYTINMYCDKQCIYKVQYKHIVFYCPTVNSGYKVYTKHVTYEQSKKYNV